MSGTDLQAPRSARSLNPELGWLTRCGWNCGAETRLWEEHFSLSSAEMGRPDLVGRDVVHLSSLLPQALEPVGERSESCQRFIVVCHGPYIVAILLQLQRRLRKIELSA